MTIEEHLKHIDSLLEKLCGLVEVMTDMQKETEESTAEEYLEEDRFDLLSLYNVDLANKTRNVLLRRGYKDVGDIRILSAIEIKNIRGIGQRGYEDIKRMLAGYGIQIKGESK